MKNTPLLLCLLASSLMLAGCGGGVTPAPLVVTSLAVTPSNPSLFVGASQQFTAINVFSNGSTGGLVANVAWSSSNTQVVSISSTGLASVKAAGQVTITASTASLSGSTTVKASNKQLVSLVVTPATTSIPLGLTKQFTATGFFNDSSAQDLTSVATWNSSNPIVATVDATGLATSLAVGSATITAAIAAPTTAPTAAPTTATTSAASGSGSGTGAASLSVGPAITVSVSPVAAALSVGGTQQFTATVANTKNTAVTWSVNGAAGGNATMGTISSNGLYTAPAVSVPASFTIAATSNGDLAISALATVAVLLTGQVSSTNNSQVAQYSIQAPAGSQVQIQFGLDTNYGLETSLVDAPSGGGLVNILVAGMKGFSTYHMRAAVQLSPSLQFLDSDHTFTTGGLTPVEMPAITTTTAPGMTPNPGIELLDLVASGPQVVVAAADLAGNVIWSFDGGNPALVPNPVKLLPDGNILINYSVGLPDGVDSILEEVDLAGNVLWQMNAAQLNQALAAAGFNLTVIGTHHDVAILPNGHLIVIASTNQCFTNLPGFPGTTTVTGDALIDLDTNHVPVWTWSSFDHLDINRHPLFFPDWTHTNAVIYTPDDGDLIISMRHQDWLLKIDYDNGMGAGDVVWRLGYQGDFQLQNGTDPVDWFYAQHGQSFASAATSGVFSLAVFDNGNNAFIAPGVGCGLLITSPCPSRAQIYQLDETAKTATITFQDKLPVFSYFGGNAELLANGNVEFDETAASLVPVMASVLEVTNTSAPQTVWQMQINGQFAYRAMRIPSLYPGVQW